MWDAASFVLHSHSSLHSAPIVNTAPEPGTCFGKHFLLAVQITWADKECLAQGEACIYHSLPGGNAAGSQVYRGSAGPFSKDRGAEQQPMFLWLLGTQRPWAAAPVLNRHRRTEPLPNS